MGHHRYRTFPSWRKVLLSVKVLFQSVLTDKHWDPGQRLPFTGREKEYHIVWFCSGQSWQRPVETSFVLNALPIPNPLWIPGRGLLPTWQSSACCIVPYGQPEVCLAKVAISKSRPLLHRAPHLCRAIILSFRSMVNKFHFTSTTLFSNRKQSWTFFTLAS